LFRTTQFLNSLKQLATFLFDGKKVRLPDALFQPMAADDVRGAVGQGRRRQPLNGTVEIGGRKRFASTNW